MNLTNSAHMWTDDLFVGRVRAAILAKSLAVYQEPDTVADSAVRKSLARRCLQYPDTALSLLLGVVTSTDSISNVSDPTLVTDAQITGVIDAAWTRAAGIV